MIQFDSRFKVAYIAALIALVGGALGFRSMISALRRPPHQKSSSASLVTR